MYIANDLIILLKDAEDLRLIYTNKTFPFKGVFLGKCNGRVCLLVVDFPIDLTSIRIILFVYTTVYWASTHTRGFPVYDKLARNVYFCIEIKKEEL